MSLQPGQVIRLFAGRIAAQFLVAAIGSAAILAAVVFSNVSVAGANAVVTTCDWFNVQQAINAGGTITFTCGPTVNITTTLVVSSGSVVIDGGNSIALNGLSANRIISAATGSNLTLRNISLINGKATDGRGG